MLPNYADYLDSSSTLNIGYYEFEGSDIKLKGHQLGSKEMSASGWVYTSFDGAETKEIWRLCTECSVEVGKSGARILLVILDSTGIRSHSSTTGNVDY